jgi:DNA polymerase-1
MAHFAEDAGLIAAFNGDTDFFCKIASDIFQTNITKADPRRQLTKNTVYGKLYGAGINKMALTAGVEYQHMSAIVNAFDARFPGVKILQNSIDDTASLRYMNDGEAWIQTPTGRRLVADDGKGYTLVNYLIQCHAAEILKRKLIELSAAGMDDYMILPVHDEVVFDVPSDLSQEVATSIQDTMQNLNDYAVPITCSPEIFTGSWGDKYR